MPRKILCVFGLAAILLLGNGCISRTITRSPTLKEKASGSGPVTETKLLWIWEGEFWSKE